MELFGNDIKSVKWFVPLELSHSSYIYTSLLEFSRKNRLPFSISNVNLNKRGKLLLDAKLNLNKNTAWYTKVNYVKIIYKNKKSQLIAFDLSDSPTEFPEYAFHKADVIFKRSYVDNYVNKLPEEYQKKIKPMGLPFMVRPNDISSKNKLKVLFFFFRIIQFLKFDRSLFKRLNSGLVNSVSHWNGFYKSRRLADFLKADSLEKSANIFYQKRLFPHENEEDVKNVHRQRIHIIRLLKNEFPDHFIGGLKNDPPLTDNYTDCISSIDGDPIFFLNAIKSCGICIYTRGLTFSTGWTLPEFLSQSKCIVAEKMDTRFPFPLLDDVQLLFFETDEELIRICKELIVDKEKRERISKNGIEYFNQYINPMVFFENCIFSN